jgi:tRNA/rRNA methyltransferase
MAGTNRSAPLLTGGPAIILVAPQLMENVGMAARAMANFGLSEMRLVAPRDDFPSRAATQFAAGAAYVLEGARVFPTLEEATADLSYLVATTARERGQEKPVDGPEEGAQRLLAAEAQGIKAGILFGRERSGLSNEDVAQADRILTFPVNPAYASINLAQAVLLVGYSLMQASGGPLPFATQPRSRPANKQEFNAFYAHLDQELEVSGFFRSDEKRVLMARNLRNIFQGLQLSQQDLQTLHGMVAALADGRPAKGERRGRRVLKNLQAGSGTED